MFEIHRSRVFDRPRDGDAACAQMPPVSLEGAKNPHRDDRGARFNDRKSIPERAGCNFPSRLRVPSGKNNAAARQQAGPNRLQAGRGPPRRGPPAPPANCRKIQPTTGNVKQVFPRQVINFPPQPAPNQRRVEVAGVVRRPRSPALDGAPVPG